MSEKQFLVRRRMPDCGCLFEAWIEDDHLHVRPGCPRCEKDAMTAIRRLLPKAEIREVND